MKQSIIYALLLLVQTLIAQQPNTSKIVYPGNDGKLVYEPYTPQGDVLPDFSSCGYKSGGVAIPDVETAITLTPGNFKADDTPRIQKAIDRLGKQKPGNDGYRGAILLKKGRYNIQHSISLKYSGIVLRGEGDDENGTILVGTTPSRYPLISVGSDADRKKVKSSKQQIINEYVPSGTTIITVTDASDFKVGDEVVVERPSTEAWITAIGMDKIEDYWSSAKNLSDKQKEDFEAQGKLSPDGRRYNSTVQWTPGSRNLIFERNIVAINGNQITLDIPLVNALQKEYGGGAIYKFTVNDRPSLIGIEKMRGESVFDKSVTEEDSYIGEYYADEKHVNNFIAFNTCRDVWARDLTSLHNIMGYQVGRMCKFVTIQDCKVLDPISIITGARRYSYIFCGQMALVQRCYSRNARHDFVLHASTAGPNAFVDNKSEMAHVASEPHHRWSAGCLWDNCDVSGPGGHFSISNRGRFGSGHGWTGAQMVLWNCKSRISVVMKPPTAQNFSIGNFGYISPKDDKWATPEEITIRIDRLNSVAKTDFKYEGIPVVGDAYIELPDKYVNPQFLYYKQLWDRLGKQAVVNVTTPAQQRVIFETK